MQTPENTCTKIEISFADGGKLKARGRDADLLWDWLMKCEQFARENGEEIYTGPMFTEILPVKGKHG